ncbi:MAG TPA: hypothetical protein VMY16_01165 [Ilumatobacteraceae bacterium]|nr:hypothetical protein [Ilumatobacteraceae bacterium]
MSTGTRRVRSPADFLRLTVAAVALVVVLVLEWLFGNTLVAFTSDLLRGLDALPGWLLTAIVVATRVLTIAVLVGGLAWTAFRRRWAAPVNMALAAALTAGAPWLSHRWRRVGWFAGAGALAALGSATSPSRRGVDQRRPRQRRPRYRPRSRRRRGRFRPLNLAGE